MMLPFPEKFDQNEWFIIVILLGSLLLLKMPKRFPISMTVLIMIFSSFYARTFDHILASPNLDVYDVMDSPKYEFFGVFTYFLYAPFVYIFVYIYDKLHIKGIYTPVYILLCSLFGIAFEWLSITFHIFEYKQWKISYSYTVYLFVQFSTILFFEWLKKIYHYSSPI